MYEVDFIGAGWSYPLGADPSGRVALVTREREIEQSIRLILGTSIGERPMRPDFGCRIHDHVFGPANSATAGQIAYDVRDALERWETRIDINEVQNLVSSSLGIDEARGDTVEVTSMPFDRSAEEDAAAALAAAEKADSQAEMMSMASSGFGSPSITKGTNAPSFFASRSAKSCSKRDMVICPPWLHRW